MARVSKISRHLQVPSHHRSYTPADMPVLGERNNTILMNKLSEECTGKGPLFPYIVDGYWVNYIKGKFSYQNGLLP